MTSMFSLFRKGTMVFCLLTVLALMSAAGGCTQSAPQQQTLPAPVTATQVDNTHILITYAGSPQTTDLLELEATLTDSAGKTQTRSVGDRHSTTPLKFGATLQLVGTFDASDHLLITGYYMDSRQKLELDTTL